MVQIWWPYDPNLNDWWVIAQKSSWLTHGRTITQKNAGNDNTRSPKLTSGKNDLNLIGTVLHTNLKNVPCFIENCTKESLKPGLNVFFICINAIVPLVNLRAIFAMRLPKSVPCLMHRLLICKKYIWILLICLNFVITYSASHVHIYLINVGLENSVVEATVTVKGDAII